MAARETTRNRGSRALGLIFLPKDFLKPDLSDGGEKEQAQEPEGGA